MSKEDLLITALTAGGYIVPTEGGLFRIGREPPPDEPEVMRKFWQYLYGNAVKDQFAAALTETD